jgi:hypothetical protein
VIWLELDPNIVKPGWTPLLILIALAVVMVLLFRSMRRQFRKVDDRWREDEDDAATDDSPAEAGTGDEPAARG